MAAEADIGMSREVESMLRLTVSTEEYLQIGEDVKIVFLGGSKNHLRIMIDAPKELNVVRSKVIEKCRERRRKSKSSALLRSTGSAGEVPEEADCSE